ncbi:membrane bound O-acyl transferase MBOAT family protein [Leptolyngbya sp. NIES-3755]|nr:membrane bound O-acyl transferase MBOAT family protein [Leptolyngbya sp. NIES-3755]
MNFADFSFWWTLIVSSVVLLLVRWIGRNLKLWSDALDRIGLMGLSLTIFYAASRESTLIFVLELVFNYLAVYWIQRTKGWGRTAIAAVTILTNLLILVYFKYLDFIARDILGGSIASASFRPSDGIFSGLSQIPPGISFYTFQMVAFVVDSMRATDEKMLTFVDYVNFTSFFPQVVAGPIERRADLLPQMQSFRFRFSMANVSIGMRWIIVGLFMKLVLSDNLSTHVQVSEAMNAWTIWLSTYLFGLQIYFDFAGYSLIALGLAQLLGVSLTLNFNSPYVSTNIQEFWRRWHITLSTWFRDYIYFPLGGSRVPWASANLLTVFLISGLWHGAGWNFVLWGGYHGLLLILHRTFGQVIRLSKQVAWLITFNLVTFGWFFFMETDMSRMMMKLRSLITPAAYSLANLKVIVSPIQRSALIVIVCLSVLFLFLERTAVARKLPHGYQLFLSSPIARLLLFLLILVSAKESSKFIYFSF